MFDHRVRTLIEALESGDYKVGKYRLRKDDGIYCAYCPLGVSCEIHRQEEGGTWQETPSLAGGTRSEYVAKEAYEYDTEKSIPLAVMTYYGFNTAQVMDIMAGHDDQPTEQFTFQWAITYLKTLVGEELR